MTCPEVGEACHGNHADERRLDQLRLRDAVLRHGEEDVPVREPLVLHRVVRKNEVKHGDVDALQAARDVIYDTPGDELGNDTRGDSCVEDREEDASNQDGQSRGAPLRFGEVRGEGVQDLGGTGDDANENR